jgi:hypothetical protein
MKFPCDPKAKVDLDQLSERAPRAPVRPVRSTGLH